MGGANIFHGAAVAATAQNPVSIRIGFWSGGVFFRAAALVDGIVSILHPFFDMAGHVKEAKGADTLQVAFNRS